jgi:hypothetical protein
MHRHLIAASTTMQSAKRPEPQWRAYEDCQSIVALLLSHARGTRLCGITGVISQYGWEPDWPVVFHFPSQNVSFQTKRDYLWAINAWIMGDALFEKDSDEGPLQLVEGSLVPLLGLEPLLGCELRGVYWPASRGYDAEQQFLLAFGNALLRIYDAGDQLGLQYLTSDNPDALSAFWERLL